MLSHPALFKIIPYNGESFVCGKNIIIIIEKMYQKSSTHNYYYLDIVSQGHTEHSLYWV